MKQALDRWPGGRGAERGAMPFIAAGNSFNSLHAAAAMMSAAVYNEHASTDRAYWEQVTGVPSCGERATTGMSLLHSFSSRGLSVVMLGTVDYRGFVERGPDALAGPLAEAFGRLTPNELRNEQASTQLVIEKFDETQRGGYEARQATLADVGELHAAGWAVRLDVNGRALYNEPGFVQHSLVVTGVEDEKVWVHNPGGPHWEPGKDHLMGAAELDDAWGDAGFVLQAVGLVRQVGNY